MVVEFGPKCRSKVGNRENLIATKNIIGMQEKLLVSIPEKGANPRGSSV